MIYTDPKFLNVLQALDELLVSENPTVRDLIQQAILVQTMENPERENTVTTFEGPFQSMFRQLQLLRAEVNALKHNNTSYWASSPSYDTASYGGGYVPSFGPTPPTSISIGNISTMASTVPTNSVYTIDVDDNINWDAIFSTVKTEADASDPKPAEDFYDSAKVEDTATAAKLKRILDKLK